MKAILEFNLPEEDVEHLTAINGGKYRLILFAHDQWLRAKIKYNETISDEERKCFEEARANLRELFYDEFQEEL